MDFNKIYADHFDQVKRTAKSFLRNEEDALDATQDTFLKAYELLDSYDESASSLSTWLVMLCKSLCQDKLRKRRTERRHIAPAHEGSEHLLDSREDQDSPELLLEAEEDESSLLSMFTGLSRNLREAFLYRYSAELSYKEIAEKMGVPINTAKTWVRRARTQLTQAISPR